jgi:hypothetical protein
MVYRAARVCTHVDPGHDDVRRIAERAQPGEHDTECGRALHRERRHVEAGHLRVVYVDVRRVEGAHRGAAARRLGVRGDDEHLADVGKSPGERMQPGRGDPVVVRHQNGHAGQRTAAIRHIW